MRKSIITIVIALITGISAYAQKEMDKFQIQVDGLGCPFCAYGLEKKFKEFKGIKDVAIDIETGDFSFAYPAEKELSMDAVEQQVVKAGYTPNEARIVRADGRVETSGGQTATVSADATLQKEEVFVAGNCGMCEARILKAVNSIAGISEASWSKDTKMLNVSFDKDQTNMNTIEKAVAKAGHDTQNHKASEATYDGLPGCCKYERIQ